jgi:copper oxidase (laccase) domain-containing protein
VPGSPQIIAPDGLPVVPGVDGLLTIATGVVLSIYVADCGAIWLADRRTGVIGLLHSGKKGTESNIFGVALGLMKEHFGTQPTDVTAVLAPCIRPPDYELDFAAQIGEQASDAGVGNFIDCGLNTASDPARFYSYRKELGKTGRMMALMVRDFLP